MHASTSCIQYILSICEGNNHTDVTYITFSWRMACAMIIDTTNTTRALDGGGGGSSMTHVDFKK